MSTKRIYQEDAYCSSNEAVVTAVIQENGSDIFTCDASCFFPEGGGQPSDTGTAAAGNGIFEIVRAYDEDLKGDELKEELGRAKGIAQISSQVIQNANTILRAARFADDRTNLDIKAPELLLGDPTTGGGVPSK